MRIEDRDGWPIVEGARVRERRHWTDLVPGAMVGGAAGRVRRVFRNGEGGAIVEFYDEASWALRTVRACDVTVQRGASRTQLEEEKTKDEERAERRRRVLAHRRALARKRRDQRARR